VHFFKLPRKKINFLWKFSKNLLIKQNSSSEFKKKNLLVFLKKKILEFLSVFEKKKYFSL